MDAATVTLHHRHQAMHMSRPELLPLDAPVEQKAQVDMRIISSFLASKLSLHRCGASVLWAIHQGERGALHCWAVQVAAVAGGHSNTSLVRRCTGTADTHDSAACGQSLDSPPAAPSHRQTHSSKHRFVTGSALPPHGPPFSCPMPACPAQSPLPAHTHVSPNLHARWNSLLLPCSLPAGASHGEVVPVIVCLIPLIIEVHLPLIFVLPTVWGCRCMPGPLLAGGMSHR